MIENFHRVSVLIVLTQLSRERALKAEGKVDARAGHRWGKFRQDSRIWELSIEFMFIKKY